MSRASDEQIKRLRKYSKEAIIDAISRQWGGTSFVSHLLSDLSRQEIEETFAENNILIQAEGVYMKRYLDWKKDMADLYGDGNSVRISAIPTQELERGRRLLEAWENAKKTLQKSEARVKKLMKELENYDQHD